MFSNYEFSVNILSKYINILSFYAALIFLYYHFFYYVIWDFKLCSNLAVGHVSELHGRNTSVADYYRNESIYSKYIIMKYLLGIVYLEVWVISNSESITFGKTNEIDLIVKLFQD